MGRSPELNMADFVPYNDDFLKLNRFDAPLKDLYNSFEPRKRQGLEAKTPTTEERTSHKKSHFQ